MKFQYYWDYGIPWDHGSSITEGEDMGSAIDRIKAKALQAKGVVPRIITNVESGLDGIIASEGVLEKYAADAMKPHLDAISETKTELDGIKSALDILSNGGPPLQESTTVSLPSSGTTPPVSVDHATGDPIKP
jgi:hypothetical protein